MSQKSLQNFLLPMKRNQKCCKAGTKGEQHRSSPGSGNHSCHYGEATQGKIKAGRYTEIEKVYFRQFRANPRRFQKFHFKISWLLYIEALFLQSVRRLTWSNIKAPPFLIHCSYLHWEPLLDINMEINWKCDINQRSEDPNKHTFDMEQTFSFTKLFSWGLLIRRNNLKYTGKRC